MAEDFGWAGDEFLMGDCQDDWDVESHDLSDAEADADTLASAGWGTDEDYGDYGECSWNE